MQIIKSYVTKNECYQVGRKIEVKGLMLHSVGCPQPDAELWATRIYNQYMPNGAEVCVHAFLQADGKVYQTLPWNYEGWHCGGSANKTHIGVEMTEPDCIEYTGGSSFKCSNMVRAKSQITGTYNAAVQLFAKLCKEYKLDPMQYGVIISHHEGNEQGKASNHGDPEHLWRGLGLPYTMNGFRKDVKKAMGGANHPEVKPSDSTIYRVQVGAFKVRENAIDLQNKLKKQGYDAIITSTKHPEPTTPPKKSIDEIAREVINGKWGNGEDRAQRLKKAGYDYDAVQRRVNEILL